MPTIEAALAPTTQFGLQVFRKGRPVVDDGAWSPWRTRLWRARNFLRMVYRGEVFVPAVAKLAGALPGVTCVYGTLRGKVLRGGREVDLGVMGYHLITTAGKNAVAGAFNNVAPEPELFKFHGYGTGTTAAAIGDTALQTEETTQYATDNTRPTGSQANSTNTYTTVATYSPDSGGTRAVTEWGLLTQAATGGGTLLDHQVFSAVNLVASSDSLQTTYVLTIS